MFAATASLQQQIMAALAVIPHRHLTLFGNVQKLRPTRSADPVQHLQSDILNDLYDAVRELQGQLNPILLTLPQL